MTGVDLNNTFHRLTSLSELRGSDSARLGARLGAPLMPADREWPGHVELTARLTSRLSNAASMQQHGILAMESDD